METDIDVEISWCEPGQAAHNECWFDIKSSSLMSHGIVAHTRLAGAALGNFLDDLTNPNIGQWPKDQAIRRIARIAVYSGTIIDSVRITYEMKGDGPIRAITVQHGGSGGGESLNIELDERQKLIAVYGRRLNSSSYIVQLSFMIATRPPEESQDPATVCIHTVSAIDVSLPTTPFELTWALAAVTSYTSQPPGSPTSFLQGLGFSKVLSHPNDD